MLAVRLPENLERELARVTKGLAKTKTDVVKEALILYFKTKTTELDKSSYKLGQTLFGKYGSGRDDLSTTYKQKLKEKLNAKHDTHR